MSLRERDRTLRELMDDPLADPERLARTLRRFGLINRLVAGWATVYRTRVAPLLRTREAPVRVLDLGCGGGDVVARMARRAAADGLRAEWVGADPDERAIAVARERASPGVTFVHADAQRLLDAGERFDLVISNHVLHHLDDAELHGFADASRTLSTGHVLHADIERGPLALALYGVGIAPFARGTFLRVDGLRSIRRSYRLTELTEALGADTWSVSRPVHFRLLASATGRG